ncbi:MAG: hypothetical protein JWN48_4268 [Myxococcaceae bacterium]|nr:hypothetical protein [Myxococcaceae bacterium]
MTVMSKRMLALVPFLLLGSASCVAPMFAGAGTTGDRTQLQAHCGGGFGASAAARKLESFTTASVSFMGAAQDLHGVLLDACQDIGRRLGVPDQQLASPQSEADVRIACAAASAALRAELQDLRVQASLEVAVEATPPQCDISVNAYASCAAQCDATVDPGKLEVQCEGGELVGTCGGTCEGDCRVGGSWVSGQAHCEGLCRGSCSVAFQEPRCTGTMRPPRVEAECEAACNAKLDAEARCTPGEAHFEVRGAVTSNVEERVARVRGAIEGAGAVVLATRAKLERLVGSGKLMLRAAGEVPRAVGEVGFSAAACAAESAAGIVNASASISVSFEASVSMSGAISGSAG